MACQAVSWNNATGGILSRTNEAYYVLLGSLALQIRFVSMGVQMQAFFFFL